MLLNQRHCQRVERGDQGEVIQPETNSGVMYAQISINRRPSLTLPPTPKPLPLHFTSIGFGPFSYLLFCYLLSLSFSTLNSHILNLLFNYENLCCCCFQPRLSSILHHRPITKMRRGQTCGISPLLYPRNIRISFVFLFLVFPLAWPTNFLFLSLSDQFLPSSSISPSQYIIFLNPTFFFLIQTINPAAKTRVSEPRQPFSKFGILNLYTKEATYCIYI